MNPDIRQLTRQDVDTMYALHRVFADAFEDPETYLGRPARPEYLQRLLGTPSFIVLAAFDGAEVKGGIVAYELIKFEQERSEIYIYDLAVAASHRRRGIATALIGKLKELARRRGAYVIFVQADTAPEDQPAIDLYSRLGVREDVLHFDIAVDQGAAEGA